LVYRLIIAVLAILTIFLVPKVSLTGLISDIDTAYNRVIVRDVITYGRPTRILQTDAGYVQSGVDISDKSALSFPYIRAFAFLAKYPKQNNSSLVVGGGAFTLPAYLSSTYPLQKIDVVEIDRGLSTISKQRLGFVQAPNVRIINDDGRRFLNKNKNLYDLIFIDAYAPHTPPFQLATKEAVSKMKSSLNGGGLIAVNALSGADGQLTNALLATYKSVFAHVASFQADPNRPLDAEQNIIILAANVQFDRAALAGIAQTLEEKSFVSSLSVAGKGNGQILTDDFAPVERLAGKN
jgi:hypothetical protein